MTIVKRFNIRVYAIIVSGNSIMLADECINDFSFTKFPGGGVEPGEGIADALKRELMEEGNIELIDMQHLYTTDFFQRSAFNPEEQIVSVYYKADVRFNWSEFSSDQSHSGRKHHVRLYLRDLSGLSEETLTFPIDKHVLGILRLYL